MPARILIATHSHLSAEFGAGQMAINLAEALRAVGHDVTLWSPQPMPKGTKWWQSLQQMRAKLDEFVEAEGPFDVIDCSATFITRRVQKSAFVVARSTQPEILYLVDGIIAFTRSQANIKNLARIVATQLYTLFHLYLVLQGWRRANYILCLGTFELQWMRRRFPWWRNKIASYMNALSGSDQEALATIRNKRKPASSGSLRFLWIGRWTSHKGTDVLIDFINAWSSHRPQDSFTIAGCGTEAKKDCPAGLLKSGRIRIVPSFDREELYSLLAGHDVGLFTSRVEGWGLSLNEMLESGMNVFATAAGATLDLQPFFNSLRPFPPPSNFELGGQKSEIGIIYYETFSWAEIAQKYVTLVLPGVMIMGADTYASCQ